MGRTLEPSGRVHALAACLAGLLAGGAGGCGPDPQAPRCEEGECMCSGRVCECPTAEGCDVSGGNDCDLSCTGPGDCGLVCNDNCRAACTGTGECTVFASTNSRVECGANATCTIVCDGDCEVACAGDCVVKCSSPFDCRLTECAGGVTHCTDFVRVCGDAPCPP